jgi:2-amino-4-hydroxy-6-hydroxymethyldihydropteridine diphosphokinase
LLYGDESYPGEKDRISSSKLQVPHPKLHLRRFVLEPLAELEDPIKIHPVLGRTFGELLNEVENQRCEKTDLRL